MGVDLSDRAERMDEFIGAMRALWSMAEPEFHGRHVDFGGIDAHPRPTDASGPPIIIGGLSGLARRRAIRTANGWFAYNTTVEWTRDILDVIAKRDEGDRPSRRARAARVDDHSGRPVRPRRSPISTTELGVDRVVVLPLPRCADRHAARARSVRRDPPHDRHDRCRARPLNRGWSGATLDATTGKFAAQARRHREVTP